MTTVKITTETYFKLPYFDIFSHYNVLLMSNNYISHRLRSTTVIFENISLGLYIVKQFCTRQQEKW